MPVVHAVWQGRQRPVFRKGDEQSIEHRVHYQPGKIQTYPQAQCCVLADPDSVSGSEVNSIWYSKGNALNHLTRSGWLDGWKCGTLWTDNADGELGRNTKVRMEEHQTQLASSEIKMKKVISITNAVPIITSLEGLDEQEDMKAWFSPCLLVRLGVKGCFPVLICVSVSSFGFLWWRFK